MKVSIEVDNVLSAFYPDLCKLFHKEVDAIDFNNIGELKNKFGEEFDKKIQTLPEFWLHMTILNFLPSNAKIDYYISHFNRNNYVSRGQWLKINNFPKGIDLNVESISKVLNNFGSIDFHISANPDIIDNLPNSIIGIQYIPFYGKKIRESKKAIIASDLKEAFNTINYVK